MAKLDTYRSKRNFKATTEPKGKTKRKSAMTFVIQKHDARRLHYDFRLELGGVLLSWAVTRGPSLIAGEKRLAVHVEDHPLDYGDFEGTIPKGEYGGGTVILWDRGTWTPSSDPEKGLAKGHLEFELQGEKLTGAWDLVRMRGNNELRMRGKPAEKHENWLLIKRADAAARPADAPDILKQHPNSIKTNRTLKDVATETPAWSSKTGKLDPLPAFIEPMLATLAAKPPTAATWIHEIKFDGYRLQARIENRRVTLLTRSGLDWTAKFGKPLLAALQSLPLTTALLDGELVVESATGASDFSALQADLRDKRHDRFVLYLFDLLHLNGHDLTTAPLTDRKAALHSLIPDAGILRYSSHFDDDGAMVLRHACRLSLEGVVSKRADSPYCSGRNKTWIKSKCSARQEFVIAGFTPASISRTAIGSLILGIHEGKTLVHVGRVGTGFSAATARDLFKRLAPLTIESSPFAAKLTTDEARNARYVRPDHVAEVEFRAWTADGHLRHAAFRGLRDDKPAAQVTRETPTKNPPPSPRRTVKLTHPDRLYWPDDGVTKEGLADYHAELWPLIAPHIAGRPLALLRCPTGITGQHFFQKHAWKGLNPHILQVTDPTAKSAEPSVAIDSLDGLLGLVQAGVLEIHPWGATLADWDHPDTLIMDLDPGEGVTWPEIIAAASETRDRLHHSGLTAFVKTSGGKGLHVVAPLTPKADWPALKTFTKSIADAMAADSPDRYTATITKSKRRGKILIDYLRNQRGMTAVAAYSTRARPGAGVSMPLAWTDLTDRIGPAHFTVANTPSHVASRPSDPWQDLRRAAAPLDTKRPKERPQKRPDKRPDKRR